MLAVVALLFGTHHIYNECVAVRVGRRSLTSCAKLVPRADERQVADKLA